MNKVVKMNLSLNNWIIIANVITVENIYAPYLVIFQSSVKQLCKKDLSIPVLTYSKMLEL